MSFVFSKNKEKRSRSSTGESNSSFVKNVTSRVSGLLPAGITKWFSSPSSSSANGSVPIADGTDSSTEDETTESTILQPPVKRLRYSSPVRKYSQLTTSETTLTSNIVSVTGSVLYNSIQSPPGRHTFRRETNFISTPIRAHTEDTMNTISMVEGNDRENMFKQHTVSAIGQSIALKRKSLFDSQKQKEQSLIACAKTAANQVRDVKQPYFKPHLLGSPFYPGRTMYGGASASTTYMSQPNIKRHKMAHVTESKHADAVTMSSSSRRVMDLLENYSSPLIDAKRIPRYELSELRDINRTIQTSSTASGNSYKSQELFIPSTASIIRMRARSRLMDSTKAARQIIASHSSTIAPYPSYASEAPTRAQPESDLSQAKSQSKLKSRLTRPNRGDNPFDMPETVELPTAVLHIDVNNLPKFSFGGSTTASKPTQTSTPVPASSERFKFSSPLPVDTKKAPSPAPAFDFCSPVKATNNTSPPKFAFGKQTSVNTNKPQTTKKDEPVFNTTNTVITSNTSNDWKCSDCWVANKAEAKKCACCGAVAPVAKTNEAASKCTICKFANSQPNSDKCANCEKVRTSLETANSSAQKVTANSSKWKCNDCWIDNEASADKCVCCGSKNPKKSSAPAVVPATKVAVSNSLEKDWRCEDCLITNKPNIEKCVACGGSKPGSKPAPKTLPSFASSNLFSTPDNKMAEIVKAQKSYWECTVCLASNANDKSMCACCTAERESNDSIAPKFNNFKFKPEANTGFKFGIDPKAQETNFTNDMSEAKNLEESETNNNIVPKVPSFTFGLPPKKTSDKPDGPENDNAPKPSFSFGIPKENATPVATGFIPIISNDTKLTFGATKSPTKAPVVETEKPQEVPTISFKAPVATKPTSGLFSSPSTTSNPQNAMNAFLNNSLENKTAESPSKKRSSASLEISKPQFSFGSLKPSTDMFSASAPTAVNTSLTGNAPAASHVMGMFPTPETSVTPAVSFFPKAEVSPAATSLFQSAPVPAPAPAPPPATSMFSFGSAQNANTSAPATEPKKFNFTFGSNTTTPTFGGTAQNNASTFSIPTSNPLSNGIGSSLGGNGITANPLGQSMSGSLMNNNGGNGLATGGNPLLGSNSASMFNEPAKDNTSMWPSTNEQQNQNNLFMTSTPAKPTFTFGATPSPSPFGTQSANAPHVFGANPAPAQNMFGMNTNASQPSMFTNAATSQPAPMFGSPQLANPAPSMGMFGAPSATPFGASNSMSTFEAPAPTSTFSFGAPQASSGIFGFGQQAQQPQQPGMQAMQQPGMQVMQQPGMQPGMYNFGGAPSPGQVQFTMGSAPNPTAGRRVRKAVRRNPQR